MPRIEKKQIQTLQNAGTADATGTVICRACSYIGDIDSYRPSGSVYNDIVCPVCGSTNNDHNSVYIERLTAKMRGEDHK